MQYSSSPVIAMQYIQQITVTWQQEDVVTFIIPIELCNAQEAHRSNYQPTTINNKKNCHRPQL